MEHIKALHGQNVGFLELNLTVYIRSTCSTFRHTVLYPGAAYTNVDIGICFLLHGNIRNKSLKFFVILSKLKSSFTLFYKKHLEISMFTDPKPADSTLNRNIQRDYAYCLK